MSGHSHWATIKRGKEAEDKKRGKIFSKLSRVVSIAAKDGGDPDTNPKLRMAIEQAKQFNMPKDNIERAVKKGTGELVGEKLEEIVFEAYGPGKVAIIIEGITDNKNRALGEIKQILSQKGGKLADEGSVKWHFERKGAITVNREQKTVNSEELELLAIEAGAEDILEHNDFLEIYTAPEDLEKVKKNLGEKNIEIESASLGWKPKEVIEVEEKAKINCQKLFELLDENDAVQDIYSNLKL